VVFEISASQGQLQEFIEVFGQRFVGLIDNAGVYSTYRVPQPEAPYPQDYIIDQSGIVRYWSDEFDPQEIIRTIDGLLDTEVREHSSGSQEILSLNIMPNPFSKLMQISFEVGSRQYAVGSIKILDAVGRVVKQYSYPAIQRSNHVVWAGTDHKGDAVSSGVYFVRFESGKHSVTESVIVTR
jgi:hypothetical protein